MTKNKVQTTIY